MKARSIVSRGLVFLAGVALSQSASAQAPAGLQEKLAAAKASAAQNQLALRSYTWVEKTQLSLKGEVKNTKLNSCRYGPDGKVQKTPIGDPPPPPEKQRGLKGKVIEKKKEEMKEELQAATALVSQYVPPDPGLIQVVIGAGKASMAQEGPAAVALKFSDYVKAGDALTLTFDTGLKALRQMAVATYMDAPSNPVTLQVAMQSMPDGTSYPASVSMKIPASQIEVRTENSNYQKLAQ